MVSENIHEHFRPSYVLFKDIVQINGILTETEGMKNSALLIFLWLAPGPNTRVHTDLIPASWFNTKSTFSQVQLKRYEHNNVLEGTTFKLHAQI